MRWYRLTFAIPTAKSSISTRKKVRVSRPGLHHSKNVTSKQGRRWWPPELSPFQAHRSMASTPASPSPGIRIDNPTAVRLARRGARIRRSVMQGLCLWGRALCGRSAARYAPFGAQPPEGRRPDVPVQMIGARVLARSAYSQGARDRRFGRLGGAHPRRIARVLPVRCVAKPTTVERFLRSVAPGS
jgi:hypothetical protein